MRARLRSWWQQIQQHRIAIGVIVIVLVVIIALIITGYQLDWTGFSGGESKTTTISTPQGTYRATEVQSAKNFWDWLNLLGVLAIPVVAGLGVAWFTRTQQLRDQQLADQRAESERKDIAERAKLELKIAEDNQHEAALQEYINRMSELLEKQLRTSPPEGDMCVVARARTLNVLRRLNSERKGNVIQFLYESHLLGTRIIDLSFAQLSEANLYRAKLVNANLFRAGLFSACLIQADLRFANLSEAYLVGADLRGAMLCYADLGRANLHKADLRGANLRAVNLHGANLQEALYNRKKIQMRDPQGKEPLSLEPTRIPDRFNCEGEGMAYVDCYPYDQPEECQLKEDQSSTHYTERLIDLRYIDLSFTDLSCKKLSEADLYQAKLIESKLVQANLIFANLGEAMLKKADLSGANLREAKLEGADLSGANLKDATGITVEELEKQAKSLQGATMPDGSIHL